MYISVLFVSPRTIVRNFSEIFRDPEKNIVSVSFIPEIRINPRDKRILCRQFADKIYSQFKNALGLLKGSTNAQIYSFIIVFLLYSQILF